MFCAFRLAANRHHGVSLTRAAFVSARNDAFANVVIIAAAAVTAWSHSIWPDIVVGLAIAAMNIDAARKSRRRHAASTGRRIPEARAATQGGDTRSDLAIAC